ncbi:hypothetical protein ACP70R_021812 [Stipagrostis hirtigluma subsp. patula]
MDPMESASSAIHMPNRECADALSMAEAMSTDAYLSYGFSTPYHRRSIPFCDSSCTPECDEEKKPRVGMQFETLVGAEMFYRVYAIEVGFDVRIGQTKKVGGVVTWKRFYCSKEGERSSEKEDDPKVVDISTHKRNTRIVRCGCEARVTVKL